MGEPTLVEQITTLNSTLTAIEGRLTRGVTPVEGLEDFKSALDDMRLRLWGLLSVTGGGDYQGFQERFRIRRTTEMCRRLSEELKAESMSGRHAELSSLQEAAGELGRSIDLAQQQAY